MSPDAVVTIRFNGARRGSQIAVSRRAAVLLDLRCDRRQGISGVAPGIVAPQQRKGFESAIAKKARHTGAGGFVQSGTKNDRWPVRRQLAVSLVDQVSGDENRPGKSARVFPDLVGMARVDQSEGVTLVEPSVELLWADRRLGLLKRKRAYGGIGAEGGHVAFPARR